MKKLFSTFFALCLCAASVFSQDFENLAKNGTSAEIKKAIKSDSKFAFREFGSEGENFLMLVLKNNREPDIVKLCLSAEIDVTKTNKKKTTGVMYACRYSTNPDVVTAVVKSGTAFGIGIPKRLSVKDSAGKNCYDYAKENSNPKIYELINGIEKDPAVIASEKQAKNSKKNKKDSEPKETNVKKEAVDVTTLLDENAAIENLQGARPKTIKTVIVKDIQGRPSADAAKLAEAASNLEPIPMPKGELKEEPSYTTYSRTYLYDYALKADPFSDEDFSQDSLKIENPNLADKNGVTLLMKAAKAGNDWDVQTLIAMGADVNLRDKDGWSALMYACRYQNSLALINTLIESGAHIRVRNKYNATPLLMACDYSQNPKIIERLLKDRNVGEDEVFRAFVLAITSNQGEAHIREAKMNIFISMGIPLNRIWKGKTPLMYASQYTNSTATLKILLDNGAKPGIQDAEGKTAFDYAKKNSNLARDDIFWSLNSSER